jgi:uncharacterized protein (TIGR00369 family)
MSTGMKAHSGFGLKIPFVDHLGFTLDLFEAGQSQISYEARPEHMNTFNVTHGGAVMTLLDVSMATAARSAQQDMGVVTIEMKTSFMRPSRGMLVAKGRLMHRTTSLAFTESTIFDARGNACAHATGTFKYVRRNDRVAPGGDSASAGDAVISTD